MWFRQHPRPRTQTEHSSHWEQCFCLCQRCDTCPNLWKKCFVFWIFGSYLKHVQTCDDVRVQSATQSTARYILETCPNLWWRSCSKCYAIDCTVHSWNMSKTVMTFVFKVLRIRLRRYILGTCPKLWWHSCSKCYAIDCFGTYLKHVQTCDDFVFKVLRNRLLRYILETRPNLWWRSCSKCYAIDCFGTYLKHVLGRVCSASPWNDVYLVHNDEILMGTAWFRARATKDPKRCLGCIGDEILPSYMRIIISHERRIPVNQPKTFWYLRSLKNFRKTRVWLHPIEIWRRHFFGSRPPFWMKPWKMSLDDNKGFFWGRQVCWGKLFVEELRKSFFFVDWKLGSSTLRIPEM